MSECCGKTRDTNYCSECGKKLRVDVRVELIAYVRSHLRGQRTACKKLNQTIGFYRETPVAKRSDEASERIKNYKGRLVRHEKSAAKWQRWLDYLESLNESEQSNEQPGGLEDG
jgi:hypothetical protein